MPWTTRPAANYGPTTTLPAANYGTTPATTPPAARYGPTPTTTPPPAAHYGPTTPPPSLPRVIPTTTPPPAVPRDPTPTTTPPPVFPSTTTSPPALPATTTARPIIPSTTTPRPNIPATTTPSPNVAVTTTLQPIVVNDVATTPPPPTTAPVTTSPVLGPLTSSPPSVETTEPPISSVIPVVVSPKPTAEIVNGSTTVPPTLASSETTIADAPTTTPFATSTATQIILPPTTSASSSNVSPAANRAVSSARASDKSTMIWTMGSVGVCVGVILLIALFVALRRRRHREPTVYAAQCEEDCDQITSPNIMYAKTPAEARAAVRIPLSELELGVFLNRGAFGEVLKAKYRDETVVVKRLLRDRRFEIAEARLFAREIKLMATLQHPRIVRLIGAAWDAPATLCAVTEYMEGRDVRTMLAKFHENRRPVGFDAHKIRIALHSKNVVLSGAGDAKLTDFGVSRERCELTMTATVGSSLWMAPEVITGGRYDEEADVFSFGVLLSELDTHMLPYRYGPLAGAALSEVSLLHKVENATLTVSFTGRDNDIMTRTARSCVALNPRERPTASELVSRLRAILRF